MALLQKYGAMWGPWICDFNLFLGLPGVSFEWIVWSTHGVFLSSHLQPEIWEAFPARCVSSLLLLVRLKMSTVFFFEDHPDRRNLCDSSYQSTNCRSHRWWKKSGDHHLATWDGINYRSQVMQNFSHQTVPPFQDGHAHGVGRSLLQLSTLASATKVGFRRKKVMGSQLVAK